MSTAIYIVTYICGILVTMPFQTQGWRGIAPLHSTREDVERLIGSPVVPNGITYDLKNERVTLGYSSGSCEKGQSEWDVPPNTVTSIRVYPQTKVMLSELHLDLSKFKKFINPHNPDFVSYNNAEEGVGMITRLNGEVVVMHYLPSAKDSYLRCPNSSTRQSGLEARKFDEYSNLIFTDEKARLDNFANYLQKRPELLGYIIAYAGRRARVGEAKIRTERAKSYLVKERGIDSGRIVTMDGGYREKLMFELYAMSRDVSPPAPTPTVNPREVYIINNNSAVNNRRPLRPH